MGDPKRSQKKYDTPSRPWEEYRIKRESELMERYGLRNKKELWKSYSKLRRYRGQARSLLAATGEQAEKESDQLLDRLYRLGILHEDANLDDVLSMNVEDILDRRLQTLAHRHGYANTVKQARQMITHGHISKDGEKVDSPGYITPRTEERNISYAAGSPYKDRELNSEDAGDDNE